MDSLNETFNGRSSEQVQFEEWKKNGPIWEKEMLSQALVLERGLRLKTPSFSMLPITVFDDILSWVRAKLNGLPPEEIERADRTMMNLLFQEVVTSSKVLSDDIKEVVMECLRIALPPYENHMRRIAGLEPIEG